MWRARLECSAAVSLARATASSSILRASATARWWVSLSTIGACAFFRYGRCPPPIQAMLGPVWRHRHSPVPQCVPGTHCSPGSWATVRGQHFVAWTGKVVRGGGFGGGSKACGRCDVAGWRGPGTASAWVLVVRTIPAPSWILRVVLGPAAIAHAGPRVRKHETSVPTAKGQRLDERSCSRMYSSCPVAKGVLAGRGPTSMRAAVRSPRCASGSRACTRGRGPWEASAQAKSMRANTCLGCGARPVYDSAIFLEDARARPPGVAALACCVSFQAVLVTLTLPSRFFVLGACRNCKPRPWSWRTLWAFKVIVLFS